MFVTYIATGIAALSAVASAAVRSGKGEVDWISSSSTYESGKPLQMAIRLVIDPGWHSYWSNPGDGGMKTSVKWDLPTGWSAGELEHPLPKRINGGGLAGFGYSGTVIFPVKFSPPPSGEGIVHLKAKVSWLTCDDQACVPGKAELSITLENGAPTLTLETKLINQALTMVPREHKQWGPLVVTDQNGQLNLKITMGDGKNPNPADYDVFPVTPNTIDAAQKISFVSGGNVWSAQVPKSGDAAAETRELSIVLVPNAEESPIVLHWKID